MQVIPQENRPRLVSVTLAATGNVLETWIGDRWDDLRANPDPGPESHPPEYVCPYPDCGAQSWHPKDAKMEFCSRCHRYAEDNEFRAVDEP